MVYNPKQRAAAIERVIAGLRKGTPLTIICADDDMPCDDTVRAWADQDEGLSRAIARARASGFDQIAMDALAIADEVTEQDTIETAHGPIPNKEWLMRSKLRVETRLKLLSKWDPKRYGEATMLKHADADGEKLAITVAPEDAGL
jgi:hypothetical protein